MGASYFESKMSLVEVSDLLFKEVLNNLNGVFPSKKWTWKSLSRAISESEKGGGKLVVFTVRPPKRGDRREIPVSVFVEEIGGKNVTVRLTPPIEESICLQDKILKICLAKLRLDFLVECGGVVVKFSLPFEPIKLLKLGCNGKNGSGRESFICPEEI